VSLPITDGVVPPVDEIVLYIFFRFVCNIALSQVKREENLGKPSRDRDRNPFFVIKATIDFFLIQTE